MVIPIRQGGRSLKIAVRNADEAGLALERLYAMGAWRKQGGDRVNSGGFVDGVCGFWVGASKLLVPVLRGDSPGFAEVQGREVTLEDLNRSVGLEELLAGAEDAAASGRPACAWSIASLPQLPERADGLLPQLYELMLIAQRLGLGRAAKYIESLPRAQGKES